MFNMLLISIHIVPDIGVSMLYCVSANLVVEYSKFCARARLIAGTFNRVTTNSTENKETFRGCMQHSKLKWTISRY